MKNGFYICILLLFFVEAKPQEIKNVLIKAFQSNDSSDYYFKIAKKKIQTNDDLGEYFFCKNAYCVDHNKLDSSIIYGKKAVEIFKKSQNTASLFTVYNNLSKAYRKQGKYEKAISVILEGIQMAEKLHLEAWVAFFNTNLSLTFHDFESYRKGIYYGKKALKYFENQKKPDTFDTYLALNAIAINYDELNISDSAFYYHKKVFAYVKNKDTLTISGTYNNIGNTLLKQKKYKEAQKWIMRALKINDYNFKNNKQAEDYGYHYERATNYTNLATIAFQLGDFAKAERLFSVAEMHANKSKSAEKKRDYYYQKAQFEKKRKNLAQTVHNQEKYIALRDSVFDAEREQIFSELEAKYQNEVKKKLLLKANAEIREREIKIERKNTQFLILGLVALASIVIAYLVYRQQRLKYKQKEQEFQLKSAIAQIELQNQLQEQRIAISRDLHDNIGSQLTFIISSVDTIKYAFEIQNKKLDDKLSGISDFAKSTIIELRDTIWAMNSDQISIEDLKLRVMNFIEKAKIATVGIDFDFIVDAQLKDISFTSTEGMHIYRIIQEGVHNSIKYASAKAIVVSVVMQNHKIVFTIADDGTGFDEHEVVFGNGIQNMKKRVKQIKGKFILQTQLGNGTTLIFELPLKKQKE